jgi:hypothetical protein
MTTQPTMNRTEMILAISDLEGDMVEKRTYLLVDGEQVYYDGETGPRDRVLREAARREDMLVVYVTKGNDTEATKQQYGFGNNFYCQKRVTEEEIDIDLSGIDGTA